MKSFFLIISYDYLQRTRSYTFLITLCVSLAMAYTFVPEPNASYSTIRIANYIGYYNASWFAYVTAIMTSTFLSLIGFYLVNSGIKTDVDTRVGQIVASTPVKNFVYLIAKVISNFMVLLTIVLFVFIMSILLFFLYNDGFPFELLTFVQAYALIVLPAIFFISALAVVFEVLLGKYTIIQNIVFFFLFLLLSTYTPTQDSHFMTDIFGSKIVSRQMEKQVQTLSNSEIETNLTIGYVVRETKESKRFQFEGVDFPEQFILSRLLWVLFAIVLVVLASVCFHRFDLKPAVAQKVFVKKHIPEEKTKHEVILSELPNAQINYGIFAFIKTEMLLLIRHGKKWLWLLNLVGVSLVAFLPLATAHQFVLPILWFLQVGRLSELNTKEITYGVHYFTFSSYKPVVRLLFSQILSGVLLLLFLSVPLLVRYVFIGDFTAVISIIFGGVFIVLLATSLGIISKGKKLFEILFFMVTYSNVNAIVFLDYFGGLPHDSWYVPKLIGICLSMGLLSATLRYSQLRR